jgi:hypothetical protein
MLSGAILLLLWLGGASEDSLSAKHRFFPPEPPAETLDYAQHSDSVGQQDAFSK